MNIAFGYGHRLPERWSIPRIRGPGTHQLACARIPVRRLMAYDQDGNLDRNNSRNLLPLKFVERLEQDQTLSHCCRHPENHSIEAWFTTAIDELRGTPDLYLLRCTCRRVHKRLMCGDGQIRPVWECR